MPARAVERSEWAAFATIFSREHEGALVTIYRRGHGGTRTVVMSNEPLRALIVRQQSGSILLHTGAASRRFCEISAPRTLELELDEQGNDRALSITDVAGEVTVIDLGGAVAGSPAGRTLVSAGGA